jgi:aromatic-L-amino-acid decarboxylase
MDSNEFRRHGHLLVDWMADYMRDVGSLPVTPAVRPGDILRQLPSSPPLGGEPFDRLIQDFTRIIVPGMTHWTHPGWCASFPGNNSPPSVLAEMLTATLGAQCMSWATSPAATELEQVTMDWLRQMVGLPRSFTGVIQDTASTASLVALLSAR